MSNPSESARRERKRVPSAGRSVGRENLEPPSNAWANAPSILRARLGAGLQKQRLSRGLTQAELAEFADLSLKYVGEIERGEANTTLSVLERLAAAVGWDPLDAFHALHEPISEGVRVLVLTEIEEILGRLRNISKWLHALDPALQAHMRGIPERAVAPAAMPRPRGQAPTRSREQKSERARSVET